MFIFKNRAAAILYMFLNSIDKNGIFLIPSNVCPIVPLIFLKAGIDFEFVDISKESLCIDFEIVIDKITIDPLKYRGVLFVHTYGIEDSYEQYFKQIKKINNNIIIIDDKCLCLPSFTENYNTVADMILYSTGYAKMIDIGYGGYAYVNKLINFKTTSLKYNPECLTNITNQYKKCLEKRIPFIYTDSNWLDVKIPSLSFNEYKKIVTSMITDVMKSKQKLNKIYSDKLPRKIQLNNKYQLWRFNIWVPNKNELVKEIYRQGMFVSSHYDSLDGVFSTGFSRNAEEVSRYVINLFNDKYFNIVKAQKLVNVINNHLKKFL